MLTCSYSSDFKDVVFSANIAFSKKSFPYVMAMSIPWILCHGQRCITRLHEFGLHPRSRSAYYRFLSEGKFRMRVLFMCLFKLIVSTFKLKDITVVVDDTLCPKWGKKIFGTSTFYDHGTRPKQGYIWGHNWVVLAVVVSFDKRWHIALPFWIALYRSEKTCPTSEFKTRHELTIEALHAVKEWFSGKITLLGDGAYNNDSIISPCQKMQIDVVSRFRSDARLRKPKPPRKKRKTRGRPRKYGDRLPALSALAKTKSAFSETVVTIYGKRVTLLVRERIVYWSALKRTVKLVITRSPSSSSRLAYLMSTDVSMSAEEIIVLFSKRWSIEQLFSELKEQLGFNSAELRLEKSVCRHAALCIAISTWLRVWWYSRNKNTSHQTFSRIIGALREETIASTIFDSGLRCRGADKIAHNIATLFSNATRVA